jgi:hypothetical protein
MTFQRLCDELWRTFACPVLCDRRGDSRKQCFRLLGLRLIQGASQAHRHPHHGFALDRQVGDHVPHDWKVHEATLKSPAIARVVDDLRECLSHQA